ncbi:DUF4760 domain-containing protein [Vibrio parahaemolyticus]|uniref:DUF4760 domain-containing protein n=1 Tax=Vibrio parahaemolyticus TaxID=670 RepID=UPI000429F336|nr:hypothetical protein [Vibrio parahaemolyticus]MBE3714221.1 hypothetical protein [Vibrio parahaemolyticus]MBE4080576.1 hypothetical protein [Vibrio parahaemolyticus]MBM4987230.1 hypothetical protein [Vibrio parahaemolyticus]HCE3330253.1 hypothetical protein [Vibrio parahaemolyticus]HCH5091070.1 hypothetical protein [Vibrio parahaemolyticus]
METSFAEWIIAIATSVGSFVVLLAYFQFKAMKKQAFEDHERSRKEKAIELMLEWTAFVAKNGSTAKTIAESLGNDEISNLIESKELKVNSRYKDLAKHYFESKGIDSQFNDDGEEFIRLSVEQSHELKRGVLSYLNYLETILSAGRYKVADPSIIKEQFQPLVDINKNRLILQNIRNRRRGAFTFPSIDEFVSDVQRESRNSSDQHKKLGE